MMIGMHAIIMDILLDQCLDKQPKSTNLVIIGVMLMQNGDMMKKTRILLDTFSTDSVTNKLYYVEDVNNFAKHEELTVLANGISPLFYQKGLSTFLPLNVHVKNNYLATILSLKDVNNITRVSMTIDASI